MTGGFGIRVVHQVGDGASDPRGNYDIVAKVKPGMVVRRKLEIGNNTGAASRFQAYAAAARVPNGQFLGAAGRIPNQLSSWARVTPASPITRSGAVVTVDVAITVLGNAASDARYGVGLGGDAEQRGERASAQSAGSRHPRLCRRS